jgi:hypothetical protein
MGLLLVLPHASQVRQSGCIALLSQNPDSAEIEMQLL